MECQSVVDSPRIVLTGGPGGGKSSLMRHLREADPCARRWLLLPEVAPMLFSSGLDGREKSFQRAVVTLQIAIEDACAGASHSTQIMVCHRGTLDSLAYWLRNGWSESEFFRFVGISRGEHFRRYYAVLHLQTAAIGAERHYRCYPEAHRPETMAQASEIDVLCARAWGQHPNYVLIDNADRDWQSKADVALGLMTRWATQLQIRKGDARRR